MKTKNENKVIERANINNENEIKERVFYNFLLKHFQENRKDLSQKEIEKLQELRMKFDDEFSDYYTKLNSEINKLKSNK